MGTFEQPITSSLPARFPQGRKFYLLDTTYPVDVTFYGPNNQVIEKAEGVEEGFKAAPSESFISVLVETATSQTVKVYITDGDVQHDRVFGTVDVEIIRQDDSDSYYSRQGMAFIGYKGNSASVGSYGHVQIYNPLGSGITAYIDQIWLSDLTAASEMYLQQYDTGLVNSAYGVNKLSGSAASLAEIRYNNQGTILGVGMGSIYVPIAESVRWPLNQPILLGEQKGVCVVCGTVNNTMKATFEWREK